MIKTKRLPKRMKMLIRPGDTVEVIAGKDKGKRGEVIKVLPWQGKVIVSGINIMKRHVKAGTGGREGARAMQGGIVDFEAPIHYSNVQFVCPACNNRTRVARVVLPNGQKTIQCKKCGHVHERIRQEK
jgi:large subunit ribosomal protein L24